MPALTTSAGIPRRGRVLLRLLERKPLTAWRAARVIGLATLAIVILAGVLMHWVEPSTFPNVWLGLWWSVQTVTSVGYGDIVPKSAVGRLLAVIVMVNGIAFLTVVIALISAAFVESARRRAEERRIGGDPVPAALRRLEERLERIERALDEAHE